MEEVDNKYSESSHSYSSTQKSEDPFAVKKLKRRFANFLTRVFSTENKFRIGILIAFIFLSVLGYWTYNSIKSSIKEDKQSELETILNSDTRALHYWIEDMERSAESFAHQKKFTGMVTKLLKNPGKKHINDSIGKEISEFLEPFTEANYAYGYAIIDRNKAIISAQKEEKTDSKLSSKAIEYFSEIFKGRTKFSRPSVSTEWSKAEPSSHNKRPIIWFNTPVYNINGDSIIASLGLGIYADKDFSRILSVAEIGRSGETYAFNKNGYMLSESRFYTEIKNSGILLDSATHSALLNVRLRNPGVDVTKAKINSERLEQQPFVNIYQDAVSKINKARTYQNSILEPYNDYRGIKVIGSWVWIPEYDFGLITEVSAKEAYNVLHVLSLAFILIFSILAFFVGYALLSSYSIVKLNKHIDEQKTLGQYTLLRQIGEGGMGNVYLAKHVFLKRPTVVKLMKNEIASRTNIARFEKEVQLASSLTHPNTIKIYDYGVTPNNTFYYAMEYLEGFNLAELVNIDHQLPYERVTYFLKQICFSLREAHAQGIVHRDIKPMNIMTCYIGREYDVIKVLDFGLVQNINQKKLKTENLDIKQITGTPQYMAPERILKAKNIGIASDIYSLGAVCYYLLCGKKLFMEPESNKDFDLLHHIVHTQPTHICSYNPSAPEWFADLVMKCLEKDPAKRPSSIQYILEFIEANQTSTWTSADARSWWVRNF